MSVLASTDIELVEVPDPPLEVLNILGIGGWKLSDGEKISYLPLGDTDDYDWQSAPLNEMEIIKLELEKKILVSEPIGICLTWKDSQVGGQLLYFVQSKKLSFVWNINRRKKPNSDRATDFDWYEEKIKRAFDQGGLKILSIHSEDLE